MGILAANDYLEALRRGETFNTHRRLWVEEFELLRENLHRIHNLPAPTTDLQKGEIDLSHDLLTSMIMAVAAHFQLKTSHSASDPGVSPAPGVADEDDEIPELLTDHHDFEYCHHCHAYCVPCPRARL
ncbi:hypothetical protein DFH07DRAFT_961541 [Mycena maculata]|uniref:Uncharacterized protein n=1 Tax=Mycena maculata TaxID=230809 RepID=A0AAD7IWK1_9AGAR|nr:hypothetical protein DFH07DRAFT_961541 [Mycena maculata]